MEKIDKVVRNAFDTKSCQTGIRYVAVLYSPACWYTDNYKSDIWLLFHPELVDAVEAGELKQAKEIAERIGKEKGMNYISTSGYDELRIKWIKEGEAFEVIEYDGRESINIISEQNYIIA